MGVVCKAEDPRLHRFVAKNYLPPKMAKDQHRAGPVSARSVGRHSRQQL
jgi:hypothetical protein